MAVLVLEEAAAYLKISPTTVYRLLKRRELPAFKIGSEWRFNSESLDRWVREQEAAQG